MNLSNLFLFVILLLIITYIHMSVEAKCDKCPCANIGQETAIGYKKNR